jgi:hypothetical protein
LRRKQKATGECLTENHTFLESGKSKIVHQNIAGLVDGTKKHITDIIESMQKLNWTMLESI